MNSISLAVTVDSWRHGLWMHCLLRCNTWNNIAVKSRKDSELHDVTFVSEDGLLCPAHKVMLWSQNALPKFIFQNIALPKCPFHPLLHLIVGRKASLRPTSCQLDGEGSSLDESESELGFFTNEWKVKFDKIPKLTFSPFGENVDFGILSKLTFHSLMKEKPLGNKVNKCLVYHNKQGVKTA